MGKDKLKAQLASVPPEESLQERLLTTNGRCGRLEFALVHFGVIFMLMCAMGIFTELLRLPVLGLMAGLVGMWVSFCNMVRRLHDLDMSGWMLLLFMVPIFGNLFIFYLLFAPGTEGLNRFGRPALAGGVPPSRPLTSIPSRLPPQSTGKGRPADGDGVMADEGAIIIESGTSTTTPVCQLCGDEIKPQDAVQCPDCVTPHHRDCWSYNGGCTTFGCLSGPS